MRSLAIVFGVALLASPVMAQRTGHEFVIWSRGQEGPAGSTVYQGQVYDKSGKPIERSLLWSKRVRTGKGWQTVYGYMREPVNASRARTDARLKANAEAARAKQAALQQANQAGWSGREDDRALDLMEEGVPLMSQGRKTELFAMADGNKDGMISDGEYTAFKSMEAKRFRQADGSYKYGDWEW
jgi:hypothetical protein